MNESETDDNRSKKLAGRERSRGHRSSGRAYIHAMTNSRVKRAREDLEKSDSRQGQNDDRTDGETPPKV